MKKLDLMRDMVVRRATSEARTYLEGSEALVELPENEQQLILKAFTVGFLTAWGQSLSLEEFLDAVHSEATD